MILPGSTVVWPITIARALMRSRMTSSVGANDASGSLASPRYQSGPVSLAEKSVGTCSSGTGSESRSFRTAALIPSHPSIDGRVADAAVQEQDAVDARDRRALTHPRAVLALRVERKPHLEAAERHLLHELLAIRRGIERLPDRLGRLLGFGAEHREGALAQIDRSPRS